MFAQPSLEPPKDQPAPYYYPNEKEWIVGIAMEDITGRHGVNAVHNLARLPHFINRLPNKIQ